MGKLGMNEGSTSSGYLVILLVCIYAAIMATLCYKVIVRKKRQILTSAIVYHVLIIGGLFMILPFYWMVITAFKSFQEAIAFPPSWIPTEWRWQNFIEAWNTPPGDLTFGRYFYVSIVTAVASTAGTLATSALAAYAFAKMRFIGKGLFFYIVLAIMMVPGQVLLIPNFIILVGLKWIDMYQALTAAGKEAYLHLIINGIHSFAGAEPSEDDRKKATEKYVSEDILNRRSDGNTDFQRESRIELPTDEGCIYVVDYKDGIPTLSVV